MKEPALQRIEALFQAAADLVPAERADFLDRECDGEDELRARVECLLVRLDRDESLGLPALAVEPDATADLSGKPGTVIGRYKLLQQIGEGGFGVVYMAEQQEPVRRRVALKIIKLGMDTKEVVARFEAERQALALMDHPNIARVLDGGATESGRPYFVMELVRGVSITEYCDENHLTTRERLELFIPVCLAVQHAHQKGVIHRDIKPSNVMVTLHDGRPVPKVIDFGVAKAMHSRLTEKTLFTAYERFIGTPAYMSPEQAELSGLDVDTRTDIYSLGVLLYELLTGTTPFDTKKLFEEGLAAIQRTIREEPPQRPSLRISTSGSAEVASRRRADLPALSKLVRGDLDWIVMKCLEKERIRRYETASELAGDVGRHLRDEPVLAGPPSATYRMRKLLARNRAAVLSAAVVFVGLLVGLIGLGVGLYEADRERGEAIAARGQAEREVERTKAASDFLIDTLAQTAPAVALDANLSVATLLHTASAKVGAAFEDQPAVEARLRITLGRGFKALGETRLAEESLRRGIELLKEQDGVEAPELYAAMWDLTHVLFALERADAMVVAQEARRVAHDHIRVTHPELAALLDEFVDVTNDAAFSLAPDATERLPRLFEETVRVSDRLLAPGHELWPIVADTWIASGYSIWYGPLDALTADFFGRALEIQERELPANHPVIGLTTGIYVNALSRNGRADEAERVMRASVARLRTVLPGDSPELAVAEGMLGEALAGQGRYAEAEPLLLSSYAVIRETIGEVQNFTVADSLGRLLTLYEGWGKEEQAAPLRAEMASFLATAPLLMPWPVMRMAYGPEHAQVRAHMDEVQAVLVNGPYSVGTFTSRRGTVTDASIPAQLDEALRMRRELEDDDPLAILTARQILVWTNELAPGFADPTRRRVVDDALTVLSGLEDAIAPELARGHALASELALAAGDPGAAAREAFEAWRLVDGHGGDWMQANVKVRVALCLVEQGLYPEAEGLLLPARELLVANFGPQNADAELARELLVETYRAWGRPEQARALAASQAGTHDSEE